MWDQAALGAAPGAWIELTENGWGALVGWAAGAANLRREPVDDTGRTVRVTCWHTDGTVVDRQDPFTAADRAKIDDSIDSYLVDAGVPLPPRGFTWFVRQPAGVEADDFWRRINEAVDERAPTAVHPSEFAAVMPGIVTELYRGPGADG